MKPTFINMIEWLNIPDYPGKIASCNFISENYEDRDFELMNTALPSHLHRAVRKRKAEFLAGRWVARQALASLCIDNVFVYRNEDSSPQWPYGVVGSISHNSDTALCAVHYEWDVGGVGIDIQSWILPKIAFEIQHMVTLPQEINFLKNKPATVNFNHLLTLVFSAKESLFKALYPKVQCWFDFLDAKVLDIDWQRKTFSLILMKKLSPDIKAGRAFHGSFIVNEHTITTLIYY